MTGMAVDFWSVVLLVGSAQGVVLTLLLILRRGAPARWFAGLLGVFTLALVEEWADVAWLRGRPGALVGLTVNMEILVGPLLLMCVRSLVAPERTFRPADLLHFLPFAASVVWLMPFYLAPASAKFARLADPDPALSMLYAFKAVWLLVYLGFALSAVPWRRPGAPATVVWTRRVLVGGTVFGVWTVGLYWMSRLGFSLPIDSDRATGLAVTLGLYSVAFCFVRFRPLEAPSGVPQREVLPPYRTSPLDESDKRQILDRLEHVWEARHLYRNQQLTLESLAAGLGVAPHHLSQVLNEHLGTGFYAFVNQRRVEALSALLADPALAADTVLELGLRAGFNSKASLNRAFRRFAGTTPSRFRQQALGRTSHVPVSGRSPHSAD